MLRKDSCSVSGTTLSYAITGLGITDLHLSNRDAMFGAHRIRIDAHSLVEEAESLPVRRKGLSQVVQACGSTLTQLIAECGECVCHFAEHRSRGARGCNQPVIDVDGSLNGDECLRHSLGAKENLAPGCLCASKCPKSLWALGAFGSQRHGQCNRLILTGKRTRRIVEILSVGIALDLPQLYVSVDKIELGLMVAL